MDQILPFPELTQYNLCLKYKRVLVAQWLSVGVWVNGCGLDPAEAGGKLPTHTTGGGLNCIEMLYVYCIVM